jgi:hypothetical protein
VSSTVSLLAPSKIAKLTSPSPTVVRFYLSQLKPQLPALSNAIFEIELRLTAGGEYMIKNPKIAGNTTSINVKGIHIFVKGPGDSGIGEEDLAQGDTWNETEATAAVFALPNPLPTGPMAAKALDTRTIGAHAPGTEAQPDQLTIAFDELN